MKVFVNFSNHPEIHWTEEQRTAALLEFHADQICDYPFPGVRADLDEEEVEKLAEKCTEGILKLNPVAIMIQGEFGLSYAVITKIKEKGIPAVYACSERNVRMIKDEEGTEKKEVVFRFVRFRRY